MINSFRFLVDLDTYFFLDWEVLSLLITGLTKILQNKSLIIGNGKNDLDLLVDALCNLVRLQ